MKNNSERIKELVGISILAAIVVVLQLISNFIMPSNLPMTLALIPIVVGSIIYGPKGGAILGAVMGGIVLTAPSTMIFFDFNPVATVLLCLLKTSIAGLASGFIFKALEQKHRNTGIVLSTISVPIINTLLFTAGAFLIFMPVLEQQAAKNNIDVITLVLLGYIGFNFILEFTLNLVLSPVVIRIIDMYKNKRR